MADRYPHPDSLPHLRRLGGLLLMLVATAAGCQSGGPSNHRTWSPDQAVLPSAEFEGEQVHIKNVRYCKYRKADDYDVEHYDKTYDLDELESVDFIVVPFDNMPSLAHTMLSFGFADRDYVAVSVETRREVGETYDPVLALSHGYELIYVVGDERDLIKLRTNYRHEDVYMYRVRCTPQQARQLFTSVMQRVNKLKEEPEYYDLLTNNCTTNIAQHINELSPNRVPMEDLRALLPGYSDRLAYDLGLIDTSLPFREVKQRAKVNYLAYRHAESPDFSNKIRLR